MGLNEDALVLVALLTGGDYSVCVLPCIILLVAGC
jgi:hypothetical protein